MADEDFNSIFADLQHQLKTARVQLGNFSTIAQKGDDRLVERFMTENIFIRCPQGADLDETKAEVLSSQLYVACFWGFRDIVKALLDLASKKGINLNVNAPNRGTLWTPLHAATFQEHGPIIMLLLSRGADPNQKDSDGRCSADFASASDKVWSHFAMTGLQRTPKTKLIQYGIIQRISSPVDSRGQTSSQALLGRLPGTGIRMAAYSRPESAYALTTDPFGQQAAFTGDVLAGERSMNAERLRQPLTAYQEG